MEITILPEMLEAGREALLEAKKAGLGDEQVALAVYMAMEAVREMALLKVETIH